MLRSLLAVFAAVWLLELAGASLIVAGVYVAWGSAAALIVGGVALVLKAYELETSP